MAEVGIIDYLFKLEKEGKKLKLPIIDPVAILHYEKMPASKKLEVAQVLKSFYQGDIGKARLKKTLRELKGKNRLSQESSTMINEISAERKEVSKILIKRKLAESLPKKHNPDTNILTKKKKTRSRRTKRR